MDKNCTICNIINRQENGYIIYEDDLCIAFLDNHPLFLGHSLISPKAHLPTIYNFPHPEGSKLFAVMQIIGKAITIAMKAEGTFIAINNIVSQSICHLHIHVVPRNKGDGLKGFFWPRTKYKSEDELQSVQHSIKEEINKIKYLANL